MHRSLAPGVLGLLPLGSHERQLAPAATLEKSSLAVLECSACAIPVQTIPCAFPGQLCSAAVRRHRAVAPPQRGCAHPSAFLEHPKYGAKRPGAQQDAGGGVEGRGVAAPTTGQTGMITTFRCTSGTHSTGKNYSFSALLQVPTAAVLLLVVALLAVPAAAARTPKRQLSDLWGVYGEKWSPRGPIMDFSFAGEWAVWTELGCTSIWRRS